MDVDEKSLPSRLLRLTRTLEDALLVVLLAAMVVVSGTQIVLRNIFDTS